jgi:O-antigen/teichoic acid export membrane protein
MNLQQTLGIVERSHPVSTVTFSGIFAFGFVFGFLLYYSVRHTKEFNIDTLSSALGAVGGAAVVALLGKIDDWIGPYGLGLGCGFLFYLVLALLFALTGKFQAVADDKTRILSQTLVGAPRQE